MAKKPSKTNTRITLAVMAGFLLLFVYEFVVREWEFAAGLPAVPEGLAMFSAVMAPFAMFGLAIQAVIATYGAIARARADEPQWPRGARALGAWGIAVALGAASYFVHQVSTPIELDDGIPDWLGMLILPLGIATLLVALRAIALSLGSGGSGRPGAKAAEESGSVNEPFAGHRT